jgi:hypothetical protein
VKVNINDYLLAKPFIQKKILEKKDDLKNIIPVLSATTHVPVIAVCCFAGEVLDWPEEIIEKIRSINKFYGYVEVLGIKEGIL